MGNNDRQRDRVILFPAYGTDKSIYDKIKNEDFNDFQLLKVDFDTPNAGDSLEDYAKYYIQKLNISNCDILIGTSFGGVLAIEINKIISTFKTIIISSIKTTKEKPFLFQAISALNLFPIAKPQLLKFGLDVIAPLYGKNISEYQWFRKVFKNADPVFLEWALKEIVLWENEFIPENLVHIHGTLDPMFPVYKLNKVDYVVKGGNHAMIRLKAEHISGILEKELEHCLSKPLASE